MKNLETKYVAYRNSIEEINRAAREAPENFVQKTEAAYHRNIDEIARRIAQDNPVCKLVMLAGPSSSGKTTTSHRLLQALKKYGVGSVSISLDDFYYGEGHAPLLPNGERDFESLEAINVEEIQTCLSSLVTDDRCEMPLFDFECHKPSRERRKVVLHEHEVAVVEGIHALNPVLLEKLPELRARRIYISVKQGIREGGSEILGPNDVRLVRRIVRDFNFRGTTPQTTLAMWANVMRGERKYIKPFRKDCDYTVNSFHTYELCVLRNRALELLHTVPEEDACAQKLREALAKVEPIDPGFVPADSIIREFIGGAEP